MNQLLTRAHSFRLPIRIERFCSRHSRKRIIVFVASAILIFALLRLIILLSERFSGGIFMIELSAYLNILLGLLSILTGVYIFILLLHWYHNAFYFSGVEGIIHEYIPEEIAITYEAAEILLSNPQDLTAGFIASPHGQMILLRANILRELREEFLVKPNRKQLNVMIFDHLEPTIVSLKTIAETMIAYDIELMEFLSEKGVTKDTFHESVIWYARTLNDTKHRLQWWSRDNLGRLQPIGQSWSFGVPYAFQRYAKEIMPDEGRTSEMHSSYLEKKLREVETILVRQHAANVLLIGEEGMGTIDILTELAKEIHNGSVLPPLAGYRILLFEAESFIADHGERNVFERAFMRILREAEHAGNVIFAIRNFPYIIATGMQFGIDVGEILRPQLESGTLHIIALSEPDNVISLSASHSGLLRYFERVQIEEVDAKTAIPILEQAAEIQESILGVFFTYGAIEKIIESGERYLTEGVMPDRALHLLDEIAAHAKATGELFITPDAVETYVQTKTGAPVGKIREDEREKLLHLEDVLHRRVVGQEQAIAAISTVMRRVRVGIENPKRPVGSFLFLGPTGVGKTETAKALAEVFFKGEEHMLRLDMSEFSGFDATEKLIGGFASGKPGILTTLISEHPFGVVLLDEFEKCSPEVRELFLQIIDEGHISDMRGKRYNARNLIIIATSNAGAELIWDYLKTGVPQMQIHNELIHAIVSQGILKPELINRFDAVVVFHPLGPAHLVHIVHMLLLDVALRMEEKGYNITFADDVEQFILEKGYTAAFGARPMRRMTQDLVEEYIAKKVLAERLGRGAKIHISRSALEDFPTEG